MVRVVSTVSCLTQPFMFPFGLNLRLLPFASPSPADDANTSRMLPSTPITAGSPADLLDTGPFGLPFVSSPAPPPAALEDAWKLRAAPCQGLRRSLRPAVPRRRPGS